MRSAQHKPFSVRQQPYSDHRFRRFTENIISIVLILITISSLSLAAVNFLCNHKETLPTQDKNSALVPAIYIHSRESDSISI